ncbi:MAG: DUF1573 domain-containing protein [Candidatus Hydrogenedentota bacterium]
MRTKANWVAGGIIAGLALLVFLILWVDARQAEAPGEDWLDAVRSEPSPMSAEDHGGSPHMLPGVDADLANAPVIAVEDEEVDAGTISRDGPSEVEIVVFNEGSRTLEITDVMTEEGCTVTDMGESAIPAGGESAMTVALDPTFMQGFEAEYELTLVSNDPRRSRLPLRIAAEVEPEFTIEPRHFDFGEVARGETVEQTLHVQQASDVPLSITGVEPLGNAPGLMVDYEEVPEPEWEHAERPEYLVNGVFSPPDEAGRYRAFVSLNTSLQRLPQLRVDVTAEVVSFHEVEPRRIRIAEPVEPGQEGIASAVVSADRPIDIENLTVTEDDFTVALRPGDDPNTAGIDVNVAQDAQAGRRTARIEFSVVSEQETVADSIQLIVRVAE